MKVLVVKLTSMGDAIHVLPALSDLHDQYPEVQVDWMIEESFAEIPTWHSSVAKVISVATRRWRSVNLKSLKEFFRFWRELRAVRYDAVIDAQGLMKSAVFSRFAKLAANGRRIGFSADSTKERPAAWLYQEKISVAKNQHAITRLRSLFAKGFGYECQHLQLDYQLNRPLDRDEKTIIFLHGTTWPSKHLPESHWQELLMLATTGGFKVLLPWGSQTEFERAQRLAMTSENAEVLPRSSLNELKNIMSKVSGNIAVDTGLGHLAAALGVPTLSVYGSTNADLTGTVGNEQTHMQTDYECSPCLLKNCNRLVSTSSETPCYIATEPRLIWARFLALIGSEETR